MSHFSKKPARAGPTLPGMSYDKVNIDSATFSQTAPGSVDYVLNDDF